MASCSSIIRHIVQIRQMLRRWRKKASMADRRAPCNVPAGHVAVTVGLSFKRYVVRATYLNHPLFRKLLVQAEEEFGFTNTGPLAIPCDEIIFEEIMRYLARTESGVKTRPVLPPSRRTPCTSDVEATSIFGQTRGPSCIVVMLAIFGDMRENACFEF